MTALLANQQSNYQRRRRCKDELERNFKCPVEGCGKSFTQRQTLYRHERIKHGAELRKPRRDDLNWDLFLKRLESEASQSASSVANTSEEGLIDDNSDEVENREEEPSVKREKTT